MNLFNRRVPVIAAIFWETWRLGNTPQNRIFPLYHFLILLYQRSSILKGIYFLICVHNYMEIKGLDSGKIASLPNSENVINFHASFQSFAKMNRMLITRLICIKWKLSRYLSPVSTVSTRNAREHWPTIWFPQTKKKKPPFLSLSKKWGKLYIL